MTFRSRVAILLVLVVGAVAFASNAFRIRLTVTSTTGVYCAGYKGALVSWQCTSGVRAAYGQKLADAGSKRTTDAGAPIVPDSNDELVEPGDPYQTTLGSNEQCVGLLSADGGASICNFYERNAP